MDASVTHKGQVTIPAALRRKYGIKEGTKVIVEECGSGIVLKVVPRLEDLVGIDAGKLDLATALKELDKMRSEDRY
jgi:AbrB family looped-hinge helix DNA binding protein